MNTVTMKLPNNAAKIRKMQIWIALLQEAKKMLPTTYYRGVCGRICCAPAYVANGDITHEEAHKAAATLANYISRSLGNYSFVDDWIFSKSADFKRFRKEKRGTDKYVREIQQYRLNWIDHMIENFTRFIAEYEAEDKQMAAHLNNATLHL